MSVSTASNTPSTAPDSGLSASRIIAIIVGSLFALAGFGLLLGAGVLGWANATRRDSQGYFSTSTQRFATDTYAITSDRIDLNSGAGPGDWFVKNDNIATVRIRAKSQQSTFVGIGSQSDVDRYLNGVAHDEVAKVDYKPFSASYRRSPGSKAPKTPNGEQFWVAKSTGENTHTLTWKPTQGAWAVVVMNTDATPAVSANVALGLRVTFLGWMISALSIGGIIALLVGTALITAGAVRSRRPSTIPASNRAPISEAAQVIDITGHPERRPSPVRLEGHLTEPLSRWLWLIKWILLVPHLIVLAVLWTAFSVLTIVAGVAILITGRYPRGLFDFNVGVLRWTWRVQFYGPSAYGTDTYPPFTLHHANYPATLDIDYPEHLSRPLVLVKSWLLALPQIVIVAIFSAGWSWNRNSGSNAWRATQLGYPGGLIGICATIAGIIVLIRRTYPKGMFDFIIGMNRWVYRVAAYVALMTDDYPPFHFDGGPSESPRQDPSPPPQHPNINTLLADEPLSHPVGSSA